MRKLASALILASAAIVAATTAAIAAPPVVVDLPPIEYDDPFVCAGDPVVHVAYNSNLKLTLFFGRDGNLTRDVIGPAGQVTVTFTNPDSGRSLSGQSPAPFRTTYNPDGSVDTLTANGLNIAITLPGEGVVLHDAGKLTWAGGFGGEIVASGGQHAWYVGGDASAFCAYLRG